MAQLSDEPVEGHWWTLSDGFKMLCGCADFKEHMQVEKESFDALWDKSLEALEKGEMAGVILSWPRGDGKAMYRIASTNPLVLQHVPYGDSWTIEAPLIRGLRLSDVREMVEGERKWWLMGTQKRKGE